MVQERYKVGGVMQSDGRSLVRLASAEPQADTAGIVLGALAAQGINLELVVHTADHDGRGSFGLVVAQKDLEAAMAVLEGLADELGAKGVSYQPDVVVISVFGPHLREKPRIPGRMLSAVAEAGVMPLAVATSISSVSCVVEGNHLEAVLEALDEAFDVPGGIRTRPKGW